MSSAFTLHKLPPELRQQIFRYVASTGSAKSLLEALRSTHKDSSFYDEALRAYYEVNPCTMSMNNEECIQKLNPSIHPMVRSLVIHFTTSITVSQPLRLRHYFHYEFDWQTGSMISHHITCESISYSRIHPKPTFATIAAFTHIRCLRLDAAAVAESRFHQIEGIVRRAVQVCPCLERVEVLSDSADAQWRDGYISEGNDLWIARLNRGIRVRAKLMWVDSLGTSWPWFWQANDSRVLTWRE